MRAIFTTRLLAVCLALTLSASAHAAIIAGTNQSLPHVGPIWIPHDNEYNMNPFQSDLTFNPAGAVIEKHFETPYYIIHPDPDFPDITVQLPQILTAGATFNILELYQIISGRPVSDWHEVILTPGWQWTFNPEVPIIGSPPASSWPYTINPTPTNELSVNFDPIYPSTDTENHYLTIRKQLLWIGTDDNPAWGDNDGETFVAVIEWPTPEPASLAILGFGALALLRRR